MSSISYPTEFVAETPVDVALSYPNLVSLDAPLVAVSWYLLLSASSLAPPSITSPNATSDQWITGSVLFATVWLIYVADRLLDCRRLDFQKPMADRHRFASRWSHRLSLLWVIVLIGDGALVATSLDRLTLQWGLGLLAVVVGYAWCVHATARIRDHVPKEFIVGLVFAFGTALPIMGCGVSWSLALTVALMAAMFMQNCLCVASVQQHADDRQRVSSAISLFPAVGQRLVRWAAGIAGVSILLGLSGSIPSPVAVAMTISSLGLSLLAWQIPRVDTDHARWRCGYWADYVLVLPALLVWLVV